MPSPSELERLAQSDPLATLAAETAQALVWTHHSLWAETIRQALERVEAPLRKHIELLERDLDGALDQLANKPLDPTTRAFLGLAFHLCEDCQQRILGHQETP